MRVLKHITHRVGWWPTNTQRRLKTQKIKLVLSFAANPITQTSAHLKNLGAPNLRFMDLLSIRRIFKSQFQAVSKLWKIHFHSGQVVWAFRVVPTVKPWNYPWSTLESTTWWAANTAPVRHVWRIKEKSICCWTCRRLFETFIYYSFNFLNMLMRNRQKQRRTE